MSPVLAQAALARSFDVQDEIEVKDNLDKNPKDNKELNADVEIIQSLNIAQAISSFLDDLRKLESTGKFNSPTDWNFSHRIWVEEYDSTGLASAESEFPNPWLKPAIEKMISIADPENFTSISERLFACKEDSCRQAQIKVESSSDEFSLSFAFTRSSGEKAQITAPAFDDVFTSRKTALKNSFDSEIYENTKAVSENNQIIVVTRLPRGSLDELLKQDVKAENQ